MKGAAAGYVSFPGMVGRFQPALASLLQPVKALSEDPQNARLHPDINLSAIAASLETFGQAKPIVYRIDEAGHARVIAGNGTLRTALSLGWTHIAAVRFEGPKHIATAYALADNRIPELALWDTAAVNANLEEVSVEWSDAGLQWDGDSIGLTKQFIADHGVTKVPPAVESAPKPPRERAEKTTPAEAEPFKILSSGGPPLHIAKPDEVNVGDTWTDGPHYLRCGDAEDPDDVQLLLMQATLPIGLIHVDPPDTCKFDWDLLNVWNAARPNMTAGTLAFIWGKAPDLWRFWYRHLEKMEPLTFHAEVVLQAAPILRALCFSLGKVEPIDVAHIWTGSDVVEGELFLSSGAVYAPFGPSVVANASAQSPPRPCLVMGAQEDFV